MSSWRGRSGVALILLIAAVAALFGLQWQARADVVAGQFYLDEASDALGGADSTNDPAVSVPAGTEVFYEFSAVSINATAGDLEVVIQLAPSITITDFVAGMGPSPFCYITGSNDSILVCSWSGPLPAGASFNVGFWALASGYSGTPAIFTVEDLGSAQGPVNGTNQTSAVTAATTSLTKSASPTTLPIMGGPVTYTITYSHGNASAVSASSGSWQLTDTFAAPPFTNVTSVTVTTAPAGTTWSCTGAGPAPTTVSCSLTGGSISGTDTVIVSIVATVGPNTNPGSRTVSNTANVSVTTDQGSDFTKTASVNVSQAGYSPLTKTEDPSSLGANGGSLAWTVTYTHPSGMPGIAAGDLVITDTISDPAVSTVDSLSGVVGLSCSPDKTLPAAPPVTITCTNTGTVPAGGVVQFTANVTVSPNSSSNPRWLSNTANSTAVIAEVEFNDSDTSNVFQAGKDEPVKQPILAWAGQVVALQHDWGDAQCDEVVYTRQNGPGSFYPSGAWETTFSLEEYETTVSEALYESEDPGEVDVLASCGDVTYRFVIYYMKLESITTTIVPGSRSGHNAGAFAPLNPWDTSNDVTSRTANVSSDQLVRVRVKGWTITSNPSSRPAATGQNGELLPAGRWVLPDDWRALAGGALAETRRPNYDIMVTPGTGLTCSDTDPAASDPNPSLFGDRVVFDQCQAKKPLPTSDTTTTLNHKRVEGPFSLLDGPLPGDSAAPSNGPDWVRETWLPDQRINEADAPMPPAPVTVTLTGSGFLKPADKDDIYNTNPYYVTHIPAEPSIPTTGYLWNSWVSGPYEFWWPVATGLPVYSAAGADSAKTTASSVKVSTGGFTSLTVYSDNHGEAMVWVNGDAGLTMEQCATSAGSGTPSNVVTVSGWYCEFGDKVGSSTIRADVDYPQFVKHFPLQSNSVTIDWTWGGIKRVRVADGEAPQFKYVIFEVTDRDGFCDDSPSLHPVLGERVSFIIDSGDGRIVNVSAGGTIGTLGRDAVTTVIPTDGNEDNVLDPGARPTPDLGVCQAWIRVSNSLLGVTNVLVVAEDPEGTITFDEVVDFTSTHTYTLSFRWNLVTWVGADNISPADALRGTGPNAGGSNIFDKVTAVYGWNAATQQWLAFFPSGVNVPGANNLTALRTGEAYWVAITAPGPVSWTVVKNVR